MLLLPDGSVMAANPSTSNAWYKLKPDISGNYNNGTWTTLISMHDTRLYYSSCVLKDGRVLIAGAEYGTGGATAEIYDPQANTWTYVNPPASLLDPTQASPIFTGNQGFIDSGAILLSNGKVMISPVRSRASGQTLLYDPVANSWSAGGNSICFTQNEATWVKLPDDSILTADPSNGTSERYVPSTDQWVNATAVPNGLYGSIGNEIGPALLLPNGSAFFLGASGNTAFYTPGAATPWAPGPIIPPVIQYPLDNNGVQGTAFSTAGAPPDAPAAMTTDGKVLCVFSGQLYNDNRAGTGTGYWSTQTNPQYPSPTSFYEYDATNGFVQIPSPTAPSTPNSTDNIPTYKSAMLTLPDGSILYAHQGTDVYRYVPTGGPIAAGKPTIAGFTTNADGSYHLTGTLFNGLSQGASYGDDLQMDSNYPIVRLTSTLGDVIFARTFNWSSTGVRTGTTPVSTEFWLTGLADAGGGGSYSMVVIANGISSNPVSLPGRIWVDFTYAGTPEQGTFANPYNTFSEGLSAVSFGGTIVFKGGHSSSATVTNLSGPVTLISVGGATTIGH